MRLEQPTLATPATPSPDEVRDGQTRRILNAAHALIRESGDFDLPMRALASRAQVSMTAPYALFQSKAGLIAALLAQEQARFAERRAALASADAIEEHFDSLALGMAFYASDQPFYRALFRLSRTLSPEGGDPTRLNHAVFLARMKRAHAEGLLPPDAPADTFAEMLTDLFSAAVRGWALGGWDIEVLHAKLAFGYAIAFAGAGTPETVRRMKARMQTRAIAGHGGSAPS